MYVFFYKRHISMPYEKYFNFLSQSRVPCVQRCCSLRNKFFVASGTSFKDNICLKGHRLLCRLSTLEDYFKYYIVCMPNQFQQYLCSIILYVIIYFFLQVFLCQLPEINLPNAIQVISILLISLFTYNFFNSKMKFIPEVNKLKAVLCQM